jgi:hypothetical protein
MNNISLEGLTFRFIKRKGTYYEFIVFEGRNKIESNTIRANNKKHFIEILEKNYKKEVEKNGK